MRTAFKHQSHWHPNGSFTGGRHWWRKRHMWFLPFLRGDFQACDYIFHSPQGKPGCNADSAGAMGAVLMRAKPRIHTQLAPNHPLTARSNHRFGAYFSANHTIECLLKVCEKVCKSLYRFHTLCHLIQLDEHWQDSTSLGRFGEGGCKGATLLPLLLSLSPSVR